MSYRLIVKEEAYSDIKQAYEYYESNKLGLGERFLDTLEIFVERIQKYPEHYQIKRKPYREAFIKDFPYIIIYELENDTVVIYAVFCTHKSPESKPKKN